VTGKPELELVHEIIRHLAGALSTAGLYSPEHPQVTRHLVRISDAFARFSWLEDDLLLAIVEDEWLYQGKPLAKTLNGARLSRYCSDQKIGFIRLGKGFTPTELRQLVKVMLGKEGPETLRLLTNRVQVGDVDPAGEEEVRPIASFGELSEQEKSGLQEQFDAIAAKDDFKVRQLASLVAGFIAAFRQEANPLLALVPIRNQDEYTFTHSVDVGILNIAQAMALGIDGPLLHDIGLAGMLHDVGKIFVNREILNKPGSLTAAELDIIKQHPSRGAQYLMSQEGVPRLAVFSAFEHHMRYDLQGYPQAPAGWKLNICSEMTMVSDTFDTLRTRRAYKNSWDFSKTSGRMLQVAGAQLNPDLTMNFLKILAQMGEGLDPSSDMATDDVPTEDLIGTSGDLENPRCG